MLPRCGGIVETPGRIRERKKRVQAHQRQASWERRRYPSLANCTSARSHAVNRPPGTDSFRSSHRQMLPPIRFSHRSQRNRSPAPKLNRPHVLPFTEPLLLCSNSSDSIIQTTLSPSSIRSQNSRKTREPSVGEDRFHILDSHKCPPANDCKKDSSEPGILRRRPGGHRRKSMGPR